MITKKEKHEQFLYSISGKPDKQEGIQFQHYSGFGTRATEIPGKELALDLIKKFIDSSEPQTITLMDSVTYCSPEDRFCKRIGRVVALSNLKPVKFYVSSVGKENGKWFVTLQPEDKNNLIVRLGVHPDRARVHVYL